MAYDNNNSGVLFRNDKGDNDKRPDYKGNAEVDGVKYWVSAWVKENDRGKFLTMRFEPQGHHADSKGDEATGDLPF